MPYRPSPSLDSSLEDTSETVVDHLMETLQAVEKKLLPYQLEVKPMMMSEEQEAAFQQATKCYICEEPFYEDKEKWCKLREPRHWGVARGRSQSV